MSEIKRYEPINIDGTCGICAEDADGAYVDYRDFAALNDELAALKDGAPAQTEQQPVSWQFYQDGKWWNGDDRIKDHRKNTEAAGIPVRDLYAAPIAQTAPQPEQSGLVLPRAQLERIERRLTDWLELNCCECESGHSCGRNEVVADRDAIRAALSAQWTAEQ